MIIRSPKELALIVHQRRKILKLSQSDVSKRVGLKQQTVSDFELNPEGTKLSTLFSILSAVDLDIKVLTKDDSRSTTKWKEEW